MQDINKVRIGAEAIRIYTVQAKLGREAEQGACALRLVAERRIGELIRTEQAAGRLATTSNGRPSKASPPVRLTDTGITHNESSQFQKLADIADEDFNECIEELKDDNALSRAALLRMTREVIDFKFIHRELEDVGAVSDDRQTGARREHEHDMLLLPFGGASDVSGLP